MDAVTLDAAPRNALGRKVKALRRAGATPLHLYGKGMPSQALQGDSATVAKVVGQVGHHMPLYIKLDGVKDQQLVFVREIQRHPITNRILHVDLFRVDVTQRVSGEIPITLIGEAPATRSHGGVLMQSLRHLSVECLPMDMPERMEVDISILEELEQGIRVSDLTPAPGLTILADPEELIVKVGTPRVQEEAAELPPAAGEREEAEETPEARGGS
jgi:large subunit ribosomal protein L25